MHVNRAGRSIARAWVGALLMSVGCASTATRSPAPSGLTQPPAPAAPIRAAAPLPPEDLRSVVTRQEGENALLRESLAQRDEQIDVLQKEVGRLQSRTQEMQATIARLNAGGAAGTAEPAPAAGSTHRADAREAAQAELDSARQQLATAQRQLENERQRRVGVETELQQLKQETSTPPLAALPGAVAQPDAVAKARREIDDLRKRLDREHAEREKTAAQLAALQANPPAPPADAPPPDADQQRRLADLQARQQEIVASANRELEASRRHEAELQSQLAAAQQEVAVLRTRAAQVAVPVGAMEDQQAQNEELRKRIDDVERRNQELNAKLKTAMRVADLIFKMRAGGDSPAPKQAHVVVHPDVAGVGLADERASQLRQRVEAWRAAWSSGNLDAYSAFYAPDFVDDEGRSRAAWVERKRTIFEHSGKIEVDVGQVAVDVVGGVGKTVFDQSYSSDLERSRGRKKLTWRQEGGVWQIVAETVSTKVAKKDSGSLRQAQGERQRPPESARESAPAELVFQQPANEQVRPLSGSQASTK